MKKNDEKNRENSPLEDESPKEGENNKAIVNEIIAEFDN